MSFTPSYSFVCISLYFRCKYSPLEDTIRSLRELQAEEDAEEDVWRTRHQIPSHLPPLSSHQQTDEDLDDDLDFEPVQIFDDDHESESEVDMDDCFMDVDENDGDEMRFFIGKDGETLWSNKVVTPQSKTTSKNIIKVIPGPKGQARQCKTPFECFSRIISPDMIDDIVKFTNIYIEKKKQQGQGEETDNSVRENRYRPTTKGEILAVIGALFLIGVKRGNRADMSEYFATNGTGLTILRANFSKERFKCLLSWIRFDDVRTRLQRAETDKLAAVRELQNNFIKNSQQAYNVGEFLTIDEMLVAFRGRCGFIQYMTKKPDRYGLKIYALCDAQTFYTFNLEVYCGSQNPGPFSTSNKPFDVVTRLCAPIYGSKRNLTTDNYFSSYLLAEHLLVNGITFLGTLRKNKAEIPPEFVVENKNLVPGSHLFGCQYDKTLIAFVTRRKKVVLLLSTLHDKNEVDGVSGKPIQILDYNATKGGVDTVDLMCSRISTSRRTPRWTMTYFYRILDLSGINAMRIFQMNNPLDKSLRREFLYQLAQELMKENLKDRAKLTRLPKDVKTFLKEYKEEKSLNSESTTRQGICFICGTHKNHRTRLCCSICKKSVCKNHTKLTCNNCYDSLENKDDDLNEEL